MKTTLVIIPTFNERETLPVITEAVLTYAGVHVLVVDDASPDGTADCVRQMRAYGERVFLIERSGKLGLGMAYIEGFKWGLEKGYDYFMEMDADKSHDPEAIPLFIAGMGRDCDLLIGSRYLKGTISVVGWDFRRLIISKFGNFYASRILGVKLTDMTSGFRCYSRRALQSVDFEGIHSNGYAFQIEMAYRIVIAGLRVSEMRITFYERETGYSKMSKKIIREAIFIPWRLKFGKILDASGRSLAKKAG